MIVYGFLMALGGIAIYIRGLTSATPESQAAHREKARAATTLTLVAMGVAYAASQFNPAYGWYVIGAWPLLTFPAVFLRARQARISGSALGIMIGGYLLAIIGIVLMALAAAQRAP